MLTLNRKINDMVKIGDDITISVLSIKGGTVSLGIDAPRSVTIARATPIQQAMTANQIKNTGSGSL